MKSSKLLLLIFVLSFFIIQNSRAIVIKKEFFSLSVGALFLIIGGSSIKTK